MKTVLISAYTCCPNRGSEPGNAWNWIEGYLRNGYEVICVTSAKNQEAIQTHVQAGHYPHLRFVFPDSPRSGRLERIPLIGIYLHCLYWNLRARPVVADLDASGSLTAAHHITYSSIRFGTPLYGLRTPVTLGPLGGGTLPHPSLLMHLESGRWFELVKDRIGKVMSWLNPSVRRALREAQLVLVSNQETRQFVRQWRPSGPIQAMFDAGLASYFRQPFQERTLTTPVQVLWVGRLLPRKGLPLALRTIADLVPTMDIHFHVVGDGPQMAAIQTLVRQANLHTQVTFWGRVDHPQLIELYRQSHLFLFPSLIDSCPMQVFEAMAMGLPVITLDHQGMRDQVTDSTGVKVPVMDGVAYPQSLASAVRDLVADPTRYARMSRAAWERGQAQLWDERIDRFLQDT